MRRDTDNQATGRAAQALASTVTRRMAQHIGRQLARSALARLAGHAAGRGLAALLFKVGGALSAKVLAIVVLVIIVVSVVGGLLLAILGAIGGAFQQTTTVWPVPVDVRDDGTYRAGGWAISSRFGWRDSPITGRMEFHDGIDIVNPAGGCPFGERCALPAMFDGVVEYVGWDQTGADDPATAGGGQIVIIENGAEDHKTLYAHLQPYRLHVQLEGKIEDDYGRYDDYTDYQAIGRGELTPDLDGSAIEMWCALEMPGFRPTRTGPGSVTFEYDRPAQCRTSVVWGQRNDDWDGWIADEPAADEHGRATLSWQTPVDTGRRAGDVALRFRAHLVPPPPPPTATPTPGIGGPGLVEPNPPGDSGASPGRMIPVSNGQGGIGHGWNGPAATPVTRVGLPRACERQGSGWRCVWALADIPTAAERAADTRGQAQAVDSVRAAGGTAAHNATWQQAPTATAQPAPLLLALHVPGGQVPIGGRFSIAVSVWNDVDEPIAIPVTVAGGAGLSVLDASVSAGGACDFDGGRATCHVAPRSRAPATIHLVFEVLPSAPQNSRVPIEVSAAEGGRRASERGQVEIAGYVVTPGPWPPPTALPTVMPTVTPSPIWTWPTADPNATPLPTATPTPVPPGTGPGGTPLMCAPQPLVPLAGVVNAAGQTHNVRLIAPAAARFQEVRAEILARSGQDPLARLADALRDPEFRSNKPGVARMSWHMTGRAIDVDTSYPWRRVREGRFWRLYLGTTDVTAIFAAHGFTRIPDRDDSTEWWHYEYRPDEIGWASAMLQVWPIVRLQAAFPEVAWASVGCQPGTDDGTLVEPIANGLDMCVAGAPSYSSAVEELSGCGPPVRAGDRVFQLDSTLGFVGMTGQTTGPHLHLGLMVRAYDGMYHQVDICTPDWLQGRVAPADADCWTEMADPMAFLPLAPPPREPGEQTDVRPVGSPTAIIPEGAPWQLPPPNYPGSLLVEPLPEATPTGQYWSPYQDGGQYGGGGVIEWFVGTTCGAWSGFSWCPSG